MPEAYDGREVAGMDLHRRSVLVRMAAGTAGPPWPSPACHAHRG